MCAVVEVTTHTTYKATGEETSQTRYYITSLRGSAQLMDYISRKHWDIYLTAMCQPIPLGMG